MTAAFCCLLSSFLLFSCMFDTSLGHIRLVVWMYVSQSLAEVTYFEYKFTKLLKVCLLKIVQKTDWKFVKDW